MAPHSSPRGTGTQETARGSGAAPRERFWQQHSPHHELPLSGVTSVVLHGVAGALLVFWGIHQLSKNDESKPLSMDAMIVGGGEGGSLPGGPGGGQGQSVPPPPAAELVQPEAPQGPAARPEPEAPLSQPRAEPARVLNGPVQPPRMDDRTGDEAGFRDVADEANRFMKGLPGGRRAGAGGDNGPSGDGTGAGGPAGPGRGAMSERQQRQLRWTMVFDTQNGDDYLKQLEGLGAILAVPVPAGGYDVIDLTRHPHQAHREDPANLKRIFWVDRQANSVASLSTALRLPTAPPYIVAFFPGMVEDQLLRKELAYGRQHGRPSEQAITSTRFRIARKYPTGYEPVVVDQR